MGDISSLELNDHDSHLEAKFGFGFDVEEVLKQLTTHEKIDLLAGIDFWHTKAIPRLNVPSIRMSDGPNGLRSTWFFNGVPTVYFPYGTSLAATWSINLQKAGSLMGAKVRAKGAHMLLDPTTVNMQRSPLGGRAFKSFSEDPILARYCAASIINRVRSRRGQMLLHAIMPRNIDMETINERVRLLLELLHRAIQPGIPENVPEEPWDTPEMAVFLREVAGEAIVFLKNDNHTLPFKKSEKRA
ncbi:hypothetical protein LCI18_003521 [Fusarium solani-melongenae]|uniref:Uncharacterized protein n=1 Tax=Fusarium solani subsp. cucurbitae TaxID=2747967 RepID=A0ACD3YVF2_FUSSC|nr:hypothetical protein LCI18_003521 [Fusarium solani-melongenae]